MHTNCVATVVARHLCPRVLAAEGKRGSLQTLDQCLFRNPIQDAPDQKGGKLPYLVVN